MKFRVKEYYSEGLRRVAFTPQVKEHLFTDWSDLTENLSLSAFSVPLMCRTMKEAVSYLEKYKEVKEQASKEPIYHNVVFKEV